MPHKLIVLRHGESQWNRDHKFCGWMDIPLSTKGEQEAAHAGDLLNQFGIKPDVMYTSLLQRSIKTGHIILEKTNRLWVSHHKTWRLNERHYGAFQGHKKNDMFEKYGKEKFQYYRRDFLAIPPLIENDPSIDERYFRLVENGGIEPKQIPRGESLKLVMERMILYVQSRVIGCEMIERKRVVLVVTQGSIVRSLIKYFANVSDASISKINAPTGVPLVFEFDDSGALLGDYYYLDKELAKKGMAKVAMEGHTPKANI
ncbi:phosphoglycerate mutase [Metschnikowia bicuspidata]|uniref:Phosphoglycerate mutase n=1 Tax=Metschnikowia bicuspidata TaxID=27322 RepID=A0A4P9ZJU5_9ASCO|nr:phosphoglycerate mutase [Metschnikowia bicuspidata]